MNGHRSRLLIPVLSALLLLPILCQMVSAQPYEVDVRFWLDKQFLNQYIDETLKVYLQNKTYIPNQPEVFSYTYLCYHANYHNGLANITVLNDTRYDLIITDGNVNWNNVTGCPTTVENYGVWANVQSVIPVNSNMELDYYINITIQQEAPRQYFWNSINLKAIISALVFVVIIVLTVIIGYYTQSGLVSLIAFLGLIAIKVILGL